mgnify:CR=1 FL=1
MHLVDMPDLRSAIHLIGLLVAALGLSMLAPMAADLIDGDPNWRGFGVSAFLCAVTGGLIATLMSDDFSEAILYIAVTGFLALTTVFYASVVAADPARLDTVRKAYTASAIVVALTGIGGYFGLLPGEVFTLYGRAKGTFQDPNVFGPFLALPWAFLLHGLLTRPFREMLWPALALAVLSFAILLSFSRAAWGLAAFSGIGIYALVFITATDGRQRARLPVEHPVRGFRGEDRAFMRKIW